MFSKENIYTGFFNMEKKRAEAGTRTRFANCNCYGKDEWGRSAYFKLLLLALGYDECYLKSYSRSKAG